MALSEAWLRRSRDLWIKRERTYKRKAADAHTKHKKPQRAARRRARPHAKQLWHPDATHVVYADAGTFVDQQAEARVAHHGGLEPPRRTRVPRRTSRSTEDREAVAAHPDQPRSREALLHPAGVVDTNRAHAIQVELIGFARDTANWPDATYARIAELARWIEANADVQRRCGVKFFAGTARLGGQAWLDYSGHCGHCHVPGNDHTDPGNFQISKVI
jgi:hypothetical protein